MKPQKMQLEALEGRCLPSTSSLIWSNADNLTLSFAPDGTDILGRPSTLFSHLQGTPTQDWQLDVLRAFQTWAVHTNINVGLVEDDGSPFGINGSVQSDSRFGDIRLGSVEQSEDVLAVTALPDLFSGTWTGDVFLNSVVDYARADLYPIILHEAGHAFGLEHHEDEQSALFHALTDHTATLTDEDVASIQSLYGTRQNDEWEGRSGNELLSSATKLTKTIKDAPGTKRLEARGDISTRNDTDVYCVKIPTNTESTRVQLELAGVSLLQAKLTVLDSSGQVVTTLESDGSFRQDLQVDITPTDDKYFIRVESAATDVFGIGSYRLNITHQSSRDSSSNPDSGSDGSDGREFHQSTDAIIPLRSLIRDRYRTAYRTSFQLSETVPNRSFQVKAPNSLVGDTPTMVFTVQTQHGDNSLPQIDLFDEFGVALEYETLISGNGTITVQLHDILPSQLVVIRVSGTDVPENQEFALSVRSHQEAVELATLAEDITENSVQSHSLTLSQNQLLYTLLHAPATENADTVLRLQVVDGNGTVVSTQTIRTGEYGSGNVFLPAGEYELRLDAIDDEGNAVSGIAYELRGKKLTLPIGPSPEDLLLDPISEPTTEEPITEEPVTVEPVTEEPITEEPVIVEPDSSVIQPVSDPINVSSGSEFLLPEDPLVAPYIFEEETTDPVLAEEPNLEPSDTEDVSETDPVDLYDTSVTDDPVFAEDSNEVGIIDPVLAEEPDAEPLYTEDISETDSNNVNDTNITEEPILIIDPHEVETTDPVLAEEPDLEPSDTEDVSEIDPVDDYYDTSVTDEPIAEDPILTEPIAEEPIAEEPIVRESYFSPVNWYWPSKWTR